MADEVEEDGKELTAKQKKNKKKKEAAKRKKEQKKKGFVQGQDIKEEAESNQTPEEKFQQELNWCIENMELGLMTQRSDKKQATHTVHLIKSLKSDKTPVPRKRQIMFSMFGDYRKKMKDVQKEKEPTQSTAISSVKAAEQKSKFLRTCHSSHQDSTDHVASSSET